MSIPGLLLCAVAALEWVPAALGQAPEIPFGYDAFLRWDQWPTLRHGVRAYMRSTFDRRGGNHNADAAHFIRQIDGDRGVVLDEAGPGILWFVRHNHWHGSPWRYTVDGQETVVTETSTIDPTKPVEGSVFEPAKSFPQGLTYTWSVTRGADLSWVPIPFEKSIQLDYGRARYGTGYFILWKLMPGLANLSQPARSWTAADIPPQSVLDLLAKSGTDIAPPPSECAVNSGSVSLNGYETKALLHLENGPAVVRRLAFRVPEQSAERFVRARLRIWWDGRMQPSVDAPAALFFGTASLMRDSDQQWVVKSFPMTVRTENGVWEFATYFPMPFFRSARIELAEMEGGPLEGIEWNVRTQPFRGAPNSAGFFHATSRDFPKPERGHELVLLDTREAEGGGDWCGHIVGTTYQFTRSGRLNTLEGDPRFFFDDSLSPQVQGTGSEEWGGGGDYWGGRTMTLPFAGHPVGKPEKLQASDLDRIHSAYRFLLSDLMPFGRNARLTLEHGAVNDSSEHYETVTYWYGLNQAGLILTDEFDVGDPADEKLHEYVSPDATISELVSSRYELGLDHVAIADGRSKTEIYPEISSSGRRTRGASEFTMKLRPDNAGVLLRRRLDLRYPNQKARVLVSNVGPKVEWREAGVWYTAGGNPVVYGDPNALPKDQVKTHLELSESAHVVWESNRRWRDDEFMISRQLTEGRDQIRIRVEFQPVGLPLFPGRPPAEEVWTEFRYKAYSFVLPK